MNIQKTQQRILNGFYVFIGVVILVYLSGGMSYVPFESLEHTIFPVSTISLFILFTFFLAKYEGTKKEPAGFKKVALLIKERKIKEVLKLIFFLPIFCAIMGYFVYAVVATLPAFPTKILTVNTEIENAQCIKTGRDKVRGSWSQFKLANGEVWKVAGYGKVCPTSERSCTLKYSEGFLGYYIREVRCS
ncbi:hypothetical protein [Vibrio porteresiae]|uniref:Uncharacterized protein n=1 Tax=Vibrio porteresiae DSM 19223 TaxID=1123496 RepID=A0ABZ0QKD3_9VIBR|nr:hypothetical protein [Vibrio porteresiae]WPC75920.1 hypothetical protein R8Z52_23690 [Vibrio porteresiae DSM 19223]